MCKIYGLYRHYYLSLNSAQISAINDLFDNFKIHSKQKFYLKNIGNCFYASYSGDNYENGVRITNLVLQFVKNNKLFTLIGSSFPEDFSSNQKQFLKIFDTVLEEQVNNILN